MPDDAVARFARSLAYRTVSSQRIHRELREEFLGLHRHLADSWPRLHSRFPPLKPAGLSLLYTIPGSNASLKPLLLSAHQDVVPSGDVTEWSHPPFGGDVEDGRVWGRGAIDYKIGVCGMLEAVEQLLCSGFRPRRALLLAFGHDEEIGGSAGAEAITRHLEAEGVRCSMALDEGGYIYSYPWADGPAAVVAVGEKGYATVALSARGRQGHASVPPREMAIELLSRAVCRISDNPMPVEACAPVMELLRSTGCADPTEVDGWPEGRALIRSTAAPTVIEAGDKENVLPAMARALVNFRTVPGQSSEDVIQHLRSTLKDLPVKAELVCDASLSEPSKLAPTSGPFWQAMVDAAAASHPGMPVVPGVFPAATDSRRYGRICDCVYRFVPAALGNRGMSVLHSVDESVAIDDYLKAVVFYRKLVEEVCG